VSFKRGTKIAIELHNWIEHHASILQSCQQIMVTEGASRHARMGKTRKEAAKSPNLAMAEVTANLNGTPECHVLKFPVRKTK
jgi:hypothetical protein